MKKEVTFIQVDNDKKKILLDLLGYAVDVKGCLIEKKTRKVHICPITEKPVTLESASILPGSELVINTNALSLSEYLSKYVDR